MNDFENDGLKFTLEKSGEMVVTKHDRKLIVDEDTFSLLADFSDERKELLSNLQTALVTLVSIKDDYNEVELFLKTLKGLTYVIWCLQQVGKFKMSDVNGKFNLETKTFVDYAKGDD